MAKMPCPNCGAKIPTEGKVCQFCGADKTDASRVAMSEQNARRIGLVLFVIGAALGGILGLVLDFGGQGTMMFVGILGGAFGGYWLGRRVAPRDL